MSKKFKIGVFCGSSTGKEPEYAQWTQEFAKQLTIAGIGVVYGGAKVGLMGILADNMLALGGEAIGVIPQSLIDKELAHRDLTELHIVNSMHERKALITELSDGFVMLPGGAGSLDEFFEVMTWAQLGLHKKPCAILNVNHYYDHLLLFLDKAVSSQFIRSTDRDMLIVENTPETLIAKVLAYQPPTNVKWSTTDAKCVETPTQ